MDMKVSVLGLIILVAGVVLVLLALNGLQNVYEVGIAAAGFGAFIAVFGLVEGDSGNGHHEHD